MVKSESTQVPAPAAPQFLFGFKDASGAVRITPQFDLVSEFENGFACVRQDKKWAIIKADGNLVFPPKYEFLGRKENGWVYTRQGKLWGLVGLNGIEAFPPQFDEIISAGKQALLVKTQGRLALLNMQGTELLIGFDAALPFREGYAPILMKEFAGLVDEKGQWLVQPNEYNVIFSFSEGLAAFEKEGKAGYLGLDGKVAIPADFDAAYDFSEGLARVCRNGLSGYIDRKGHLVIPCEWEDPVKISFSGDNDSVTAFKNGFAKVARPNNIGLTPGFIDKNGKWYSVDSVPSKPEPEFKSFRAENPAWLAQQQSVPLDPQFEKALLQFRKKIEQAQAKDRPAAIAAVQQICKADFPKEMAYLKLIVYDMNDFGISVIPCSPESELDSPLADGINPLKTIAKAHENNGIEEPKTAKAHQALNEFLNQISSEFMLWFADLWNEAGGHNFRRPVYITSEVESQLLDLKTKKIVTEDEIRSK